MVETKALWGQACARRCTRRFAAEDTGDSPDPTAILTICSAHSYGGLDPILVWLEASDRRSRPQREPRHEEERMLRSAHVTYPRAVASRVERAPRKSLEFDGILGLPSATSPSSIGNQLAIKRSSWERLAFSAPIDLVAISARWSSARETKDTFRVRVRWEARFG